jgi:hypothetical protein
MHAHTYHPYLHPFSPQTQNYHPSIGWTPGGIPSHKSLHRHLINNLFTQVFFLKKYLLKEIKKMEKIKPVIHTIIIYIRVLFSNYVM